MAFSSLGATLGYNAQVSSWNHPAIWPGGHWTYTDIVRYQVAASWALLVQAAETRTGFIPVMARRSLMS